MAMEREELVETQDTIIFAVLTTTTTEEAEYFNNLT
jgi:hypothetical protein